MTSTTTHVFGLVDACPTHVFDATFAGASPSTLGYTLAGSPPGNLRTGRSAPCA